VPAAVKVSGIPATTMKHEADKASGSSVPKMEPKMVTKHESAKPSQMGLGRGGITEDICDDQRLPGKPLRILRLYKT
jgi:hypothetical protein